jgi:P4 family phage/plasmid primase-like protien
MAEINKKMNHHKVDKLKFGVESFLSDYRVGAGAKFTHVAMGDKLLGKFFLDSEKGDLKKFRKLYSEAIDYGVEFHIAEKLKDYGPLLIDIDLEIPLDDYNDGRLYNNKMILEIISNYREAIKEYLDVTESDVEASVFEKPNPTKKSTVIKDGFHIIFSNICTHYKVRHLIRNSVIKKLSDDDMFNCYTKPIKDIIDKAVVSTNPWLMYGSRKKDGYLYNLTKIINFENNELCIDKLLMNKNKIVKKYSLQQDDWNDQNSTPLLSHLEYDDIDLEYSKIGERQSTNNNIFNESIITESKEDEIRKATYFVSLLSTDRCDNYDSWIRLGWALHNIDDSMLNVWIDFSRKSPKFKEGDCDDRWKSMRNEGLTIRSLMLWAEEDNYNLYHQFMSSEFNNLLNKSLDGSTYNVAKALHSKYLNRFVCASIKSHSWYEFRNHRWVLIYDGYSLRREISEKFVDEYSKLVSKYSLLATQLEGVEKDEAQVKASRTQKIVEKLKDISFKDKIMKECEILFFDPEFEKKLDENYDLIGFNNGVYDLINEEFRDGRPDDSISKSTNVDYSPFNMKNPYTEKMFKFFKEILPNEAVRNYFLLTLSTCVSGHNKEEKLNIATGSGSNGKSLLFSMVQLALGDYYISCPITIITRKRGSSNQASPELLRIKGARCGCFQETDDGEKLNVGIMKEITGNDSFMVRGLFADPIEIKPQIKFFLACNQLPTVPSTDGGTWRRLRVIGFNSKFTESPAKPNEFLIDNTLKQKIKDWGPIFSSYLIHLYVTQYKKLSTLTEPVEVQYSTNSYKMENDHFTEFHNIKIAVTNEKKDSITIKSMYEEFKLWFKDTHDGAPVPKQLELNKFLYEKLGEPKGGKWKGYRFKDEKDNDTDSDNENVLDI